MSEILPFKPVNIAVLTISDTRTFEDDKSGDLLSERIVGAGHNLVDRKIVTDDIDKIQSALLPWINAPEVDVIVTTGGTGLTGRDITPEAVRPLLDKEIDGFAAIFHMISFKSVGVSTLQSRALAGIANGTFLFALPGSSGGVKDGWDHIIVHELNINQKPCNLIALMPRLMES